mmetsp:Transcript_6099/g.9381  ORF Transcript_6099/g.9381 Transcript_6099/m.9381 type:complete len:90 (+) Transcript_6099:122-391(+)
MFDSSSDCEKSELTPTHCTHRFSCPQGTGSGNGGFLCFEYGGEGRTHSTHRPHQAFDTHETATGRDDVEGLPMDLANPDPSDRDPIEGL